MGALRTTGLTAPLVIDGTMNGELFLAYVQQQLAPTLTPGDIVVMDNLSSHRLAGVREAASRTLVYRPPYRPDQNPIERLFSKLKSRRRKHAERTRDSVWNRIG